MAELTLAWVSGSPSQLHKQDGGQLEKSLAAGIEETTAASTNLPELSTTIGPPESPLHAKPSFISDLWINMLLGRALKSLIEYNQNQVKKMA